MNLEQLKGFTGQTVGFGSSRGECGAFASYWFSELTQNRFQFAYGKPNIVAQWAIGSDCYSAHNVMTQADWGAMGFEIIYNPTFNQLKPGDIFFISAREGLTTGHVGVVYSLDNWNVTTLEQNVFGARYVQFMPGANSWSYYNGFTAVVRPKQNVTPPKEETNTSNTQEGANIDMILYQIYDKTGAHKGKWYVSNGTHLRYIRTPRVLKKYQELKLPVDVIYSSELFKDFPEKTIL